MSTYFGHQPVIPRHSPDPIPLIERILNRLFKKREIVNCDHDVYLHRWFIYRGTRIGIYIHKFVRSDEDRAVHDHPWDFLVIPLWRGYIEHSEVKCPYAYPCIHCAPGHDVGFPKNQPCRLNQVNRVRPILGTRFRRAEYRHRVELLPEMINTQSPWDTEGILTPEPTGRDLPSWSLFIRFTKRRQWGFWTNNVFQHWNKWWQEKCE